MSNMRGVSLIEALVALAVMAFGMLGVVGMQGSMRWNADIAKQRSEAVRIAQETIETRRSYWTLSTVGTNNYNDIATRPAVTVAGIASNATFTVTETISTPPGGGRTKTLTVDVSWVDRTGQSQSVRLSTNVTGTLPELSGSLGLPALGNPVRLPRGRHAAIPPAAVDQGDGTSKFSPPNAGGISWVFNNVSGFITQLCAGLTCTDFNARFLTGYVRFEIGAAQPTEAMAEAPTGAAFALDANVVQTFPTAGTVACFTDAFSSYVIYFCAMPVEELLGNKWTGSSELTVAPLATSIADKSASSFRVCRYTPVRDAHPVVPTISNADHPLKYVDVNAPLVNQNFLVIRAGDGTTAFTCPADDASTPFVNGNTWHHQPSV